MLALKKRKVNESEQSRKCNDMHIHPAEQHRSDYMLDEAKENSEMCDHFCLCFNLLESIYF